MKTMKSRIIILSVLALLFTVSCEDFLEETTYSQLTPELLYTSYTNAQLAINGLYIASFHDRLGYQMFWPAAWGARNQEFSNYNDNTNNDLQWNSGWTQNYWIWRNYYRAINACNSAIAGIEGMSDDLITTEQRNALLGEAYMHRGHNYVEILCWWGGAPILLEPTNNPEEAFQPRSNAQAVFDQAKSDLEFAQANLPWNHKGGFPDNGRATSGSATSRLAQLYMRASGEQFKGNAAVAGDANFNNLGDHWAAARAELVKLIDVNNPAQAAAPYMYALEPDLAFLYTGGDNPGGTWSPVRIANDLGPEIIWTTTYEPTVLSGTWNFNHWNGRRIAPYILDKFEKGEYRAAIKQDSTIRASEHDTLAGRYRNVYRHFKRNYSGNDNDNNFYFARYGTMLLKLAYVENEINGGPTALAEQCLNLIRARARAGDGTTTYTIPADVTPGLSYDAFKQEVYDEMCVETMGEQKFWHDAWMTGYFERDWADIASGADGSRGPYDSRWKLFPIPQREIDASGDLLIQNPGH